ncbi:MFS transporter [Candidatus Odyssella acanthamoebae]|uniref:MFS transporter n=1 Tax=Candidatus Odyssella acanthamoebae TaxID=91604 RepID=UPI00068B1627|nr:MFS transporter [Candidatus Paracaedibacter acanthamoebae]
MNNHTNNNSHLPQIPRPIWGIGLAVFFVNLSSVMVRSISAVYMKTILGAGSGLIGTIEGIVEMLSYLMKMMSGVFSDYLRRRKFIIVLGYTFMFLSRPLIAAFGNMQAVIAARILDRLGNGIQASPRDALVGDLAPKSIRGACYGLRVSLGTAGSFAGAVFALCLMLLHNEDYLMVFWLAAIPALISVLILVFFIKEPEQNIKPADLKARHPIHMEDIPRLGRPYWLLMIVVGVFMIAQLGEPIMVLHAHENFQLSGKYIPLILIVYNSTYSSISYPAGKLSDKIGRINMLIVGFCCLLAGDLFLTAATDLWMIFVGIALCGAQMAVTQSIFMSLIADCVPEDLRGTGFGVFYLICAISVLISNTGAGFIAESMGERYAFAASLAVASLALTILLFFARKIAPREKLPLSA